MSLSTIYTKTAKGLRAHKSLFGRLSAQQIKVLTLVDGSASVEAISKQLVEISEKNILATVHQLESDGLIKFLAEANNEDDAALADFFTPMQVEEINEHHASSHAEAHIVAEQEVLREIKKNVKNTEDKQKHLEETLFKAKQEAQALVDKIRTNEKTKREQTRLARKTEAAQRKAKLDAQAAEKAKAEQIKADALKQQALLAQAEQARLDEAKLAHEAAQALELAQQQSLLKAAEDAQLAALHEIELEAKMRILAKEELRAKKARLVEEKARIKAEEQQRKEAEQNEKYRQKLRASSVLALEEFPPLFNLSQIYRKRKRTRRLSLNHAALKRGLIVIARYVFVYLPLVLLATVAVLHFVNLSFLAKPVENYTAALIGEPVAVKEVRMRFWPSPHLKLGQLALGGAEPVHVASVQLVPQLSSLWSGPVIIESLTISGAQFTPQQLSKPLDWLHQFKQNQQLNLHALSFNQINFDLQGVVLGPFNGQADFNANHALQGLNLMDEKAQVAIHVVPQQSLNLVTLKAVQWSPTWLHGLLINSLNAKGVAASQGLLIDSLEAELLGGKLTGSLQIRQPKMWQVEGEIQLENVNTDEVLKAFSTTTGVGVEGKLNLSAHLSSQADLADALVQNTTLIGQFQVGRGKLIGVDLAQALMSPNDQSLQGDATGFDALTGLIELNKQRVQYRQLALEAPKLRASGQVTITKEHAISGQITANLLLPSRQIKDVMHLAGQLQNVRRQ